MNPVDDEYFRHSLEKENAARILSKLSLMEPEERSAKLKQAGIDEKSFQATMVQEGQEIEPDTGAQPVGIFEDPSQLLAQVLALPLTGGGKLIASLLYSTIFGKAMGGAVQASGGGPVLQSIAELIGGLVNPAGEEKLLGQYGPEALSEMKQVMHSEANVDLLKKISEGIKSGEITAEKLPIKFMNKLKGILKPPNDSALRALKAGFVPKDTEELIMKAQSRRVNRLIYMLNILKKSEPEEQKILLPAIADEFIKYQQLAMNKIKDVSKSGNTILRNYKVEWTDQQLEQIKQFSMVSEFPDVLGRVLNNHYNPLGNQKGAIDLKLLTFGLSLAKSKGESLMERLYKAEVNAQLMNPAITIRKAVTDIGWVPFQRLSQSIAMAKKHKSLTVGTRSLIAAMTAYKESLPEAMRIAEVTFKSGEPEFEHILGISKPHVYAEEAFDSTDPGKVANYMASWYTVGSRGVMSADQFAKVLTYRSSMYMYALDHSLEELSSSGKSGPELLELATEQAQDYMKNPPDWLLEANVEDMYKTTFTDSNKLIQRLTGLTRDYPALRVIFPYIRTPINLYKEGLKMTPLGFGMALMDESGSLERGTTQAKAALGSLFALYIHDQVLKGNITGSGPSNPNHYNMKLPEPYTMWGHSYQHLGPLASYIALIADASEAMGNAEPSDVNHMSDAIITAIATSLSNAPTLDGVINLTNILETARKGKTAAVADFLSREATGFIPAPARLITQINDPVYREARGLVDRVRKTIPGLSTELPPYRKWDGTPQYIPPGVNADGTPPTTFDVLTNMMSPIPGHLTHMDDLDKELARLNIEYKRTPDHMRIGGKLVPVPPNLRDEWSVLSGQFKLDNKNQRDRGLEIIKDSGYQSADDEHKKIMLKANHHYYVGVAENLIRQKLSDQLTELPSEQLPGGTQNEPHYFYNIWQTPGPGEQAPTEETK